jgi:hypothetical protein
MAAAWAGLLVLPNRAPRAFRWASAARVRSEIKRRSFLGERRVEVQHKGIGIGAEFGNDETGRFYTLALVRCSVPPDGDCAASPVKSIEGASTRRE